MPDVASILCNIDMVIDFFGASSKLRGKFRVHLYADCGMLRKHVVSADQTIYFRAFHVNF